MDYDVREFLEKRGCVGADKEAIEKVLRNASPEWQIQIWNEYCEANRYSERIFDNYFENINDYISDARNLISMIHGRYNYNDRYFYISDCEELVSFDDPAEDNSPIYLDDVAEWIERNI